jgi:hypothetical protein
MPVSSGLPWYFELALREWPPHFGPDPGPIEVQIEVQAQHVPFEWHKQERVKEIAGILKSAGVQLNRPLYLLPSLHQTLKSSNLQIKVGMKDGKMLVEKSNRHLLHHAKEKLSNFVVSGTIPKTAKRGDVFLVKVTAHYPKTKEIAASAIEFLEFLHVTK